MPSIAETLMLLLQHMPRGAAKWMRLDTTTDSTVGRMWSAISQAAKTYGYDILDTLRRELKGRQITDRLSTWEGILSILTDASLSYDQRRGRVIARRREYGASTLPGILGAVSAIVGPTAASIIEHSRSVLTALFWYEIPGGLPLAIPPSADLDLTFPVTGNAVVSEAGARFTVRISHVSVEDLRLRIYAPDGDNSGFYDFGSGLVSQRDYVFRWACGGKSIGGTWRAVITDSGAVGGQVDDPAGDGITGLHVEDIGRDPLTDVDGLGARCFEANVFIDENATQAGYSRQAARQVVMRWAPGHTILLMALRQTNGDTGAVCGDANCIAGMTVCGN